MLPLESVPNVSEGRDAAVIEAIGDAFAGHASLLDVHADPDHNRSVYTLVGSEQALQDALVAGIRVAKERIDLRRHEGVHPRVGAADVVPIVPIRPEDMPRAKRTARLLAKRLTASLGLTFLYGEVGDGRGPAFFRRGGTEELQRRLEAGEVAPAYGPPWLDPAAGAVLVGARRPLIAFNVNLRGTVEAAREIAAVVRETGGGFPGVRALGLDLPAAGHAQVSMNVEDWEAARLHEIVARGVGAAWVGGATGRGSVIGALRPAGAAPVAGAAALRLDRFDASRVLELRLLDR